MKRSFFAIVTMAALASAPAVAGQTDETDQERVTGKAPPPLDLDAIKEPRQAQMDFKIDPEMTVTEYGKRTYNQITYLGAQALSLDPDFVYAVQTGLDMVFKREYSEARAYFTKVEEKYPGTGVAAVADTLVWQALMLENFDFRFDKQYWVSTKQARADLSTALDKAGNEGWEHFLMAGIVGIEAIHTMRQNKYLSALQLAFNAMDHIEKSRAAAPDFRDILLADGLYNYWRSVVTMNTKVLPDFGDMRVEGIEQMKEVQAAGFFLQGPATLSLAFTWLEEGQLKRAADACSRNRREYPKNIINNLVTGTTYIYQKHYDKALGVLNEVLETDPENKRVRYWLGLANLRKGDLDAAHRELTAYLAVDYMEDWQRANAQYRLGQVYARQKKWGESYASYKDAVKTNKHKGAKKAAERLERRQKEGKIKI